MPKRAADKVGRSDVNEIAAIASLYYTDGKTQQEIAAYYKVSQGEVSRCLTIARERGIVQISIDTSYNEDLDVLLKEHFDHLQDMIIVPHMQVADKRSDPVLLQALGRECAQYLLSITHHGSKIGISCGTTVAASIRALETLREQDVPMPHGCDIRPLSTKLSSMVTGITQASLVSQLVQVLPQATGKALQLPSISCDADGAKEVRAYKKHPEIRALLSEIEAMNHYVVGIGAIDYTGDFRRDLSGAFRHTAYDIHDIATYDFNVLIRQLGLVETLQRLDAVGEVLSQPFNSHGEFLIDLPELQSLKNTVLTLPYNILWQHVQCNTASIVAVAGGVKKHQAIHAALHAKICNALVTDSGAAAYVLKHLNVARKSRQTAKALKT